MHYPRLLLNLFRTQASNLVPQIMPNFVLQRSIYEARERPAKIYSWQVFMLSNILVEVPWNTLMAVFTFVAWYYPIGFYRYAELTNALAERGGTMFLFMWVYMLFMSTFGHMVQAGVDLAEIGGNYANLLFMISLIFCGSVKLFSLLSSWLTVGNQSSRGPERSPRLLGLHVPRFSVHLPRQRYPICWSG